MTVVISLKLVYTPVDDNVTSPHKSQVTSHFEASKQASFMGPVDDSVTTNTKSQSHKDLAPAWSFGFDSQTRGTRESRRTLC